MRDAELAKYRPMADPETFAPIHEAAESPVMMEPQPRESSTDAGGIDPKDLPESHLQIDLDQLPQTIKTEEIPSMKTLIPAMKRVKFTNIGIQEQLKKQEADMFPPPIKTSDKGAGKEKSPQPSTSATQSVEQPIHTLAKLGEAVSLLASKLTQLTYLIEAQSKIVSVIGDLQEDVKLLTAQVVGLRSDVARLTGLLETLLPMLSQIEAKMTMMNQSAQAPTGLEMDVSEEDPQVSDYYDKYISSCKFQGLTKQLFLMLYASKDAYLRAKKMFPGLLLTKENFECFRTGLHTLESLTTLNKEFLRLTSPLHKETYLPPRGTGIHYKGDTAGSSKPQQVPGGPPMFSDNPTDEELKALFWS
jgi:hypothetical protein